MIIARPYLLALVSALTVTAAAEKPARAEWNVRQHMTPTNIIVQSHRGAGELAPENTIEAFELGWKLGTYPEADVRTTTDGKIVAFHDKNFERVVKDVSPELAKKGVEDLTYEELRNLDVGSWMGESFIGHHISTLDEVFTLMDGKPDRHLYLDIKKVDFPQLAELVKKHEIQNQIVLASPNQDQLVEWQKLVPESDTLLWIGGKSEDEQSKKFEAAKARNFEGITQVQIHTRLTTGPEHIDRESVDPFSPSDKFMIAAGNTLREKGILFQTLPWKGSTNKTYWKLLDLGLMSFASDHPDVTRKAIVEYYALPDAPKSAGN